MSDKRTKAELSSEISEYKEALDWKAEQLRVFQTEARHAEQVKQHYKAEAERLAAVANRLEQQTNMAKEHAGDTLHTTQTALRTIMEVMGKSAPRLDDYPHHYVNDWNPF